jgi:hypothetical protein
MFSFIETKLFSRLIAKYLSDEEYALLQNTLIANPEAGSLVVGSGGCESSDGLCRDGESVRAFE